MAPASHKKRKHAPEPAAPHKKAKKDAPVLDAPKKNKGKARAPADSEFQVVRASLVISVPPAFTADPARGALEMLDSMVMRYIPAFQGVVLSHSNLDFLSHAAQLRAECPFLVCKIAFSATVWHPHIGMKLVGRINLSSPDHISLLLHRTFNVSIPRRHIPEDQWEFEYGAAENDPEFGPAADTNEDEDEKAVDSDTGGRWVHHLTREPLAGESRYLSFTVIGLTIANEMLSLVGSIQPDPFDSRHDAALPQSPAEEDVEDGHEPPQAPLRVEDDDESIADDDDDAEDLMRRLGREADAAREAEQAAAAQAEADKAAAKAAKKEKKKEGESKKEKKRKREQAAADTEQEPPQLKEGKKKRKKASD
ncbi:hypothetical protein BD626DRAFT_390586 [Schizophyllum amplum]|uniref:RPA43 OB domain-containing protein n=1 Tax=Schizophyllum amplum TaxID=97359 RepID=A0A550CXV5_9AGAR|nr:hypothetical protein BD626DRAFT_390586 [Auriculariopsis ampla]